MNLRQSQIRSQCFVILATAYLLTHMLGPHSQEKKEGWREGAVSGRREQDRSTVRTALILLVQGSQEMSLCIYGSGRRDRKLGIRTWGAAVGSYRGRCSLSKS